MEKKFKIVFIIFVILWVVLFASSTLLNMGTQGKLKEPISIILTDEFMPTFKPYTIIKETAVLPEMRSQLKEGDIISYTAYYEGNEYDIYAKVLKKVESEVEVQTLGSREAGHFVPTVKVNTIMYSALSWLSPMIWLFFSLWGKIILGVFGLITAIVGIFLIKEHKKGNI